MLPKQGQSGRPRADDRKVLNGILYVLRTGCRWKDMPREYGAYVTAWRRLKRWQEEGIWTQIWQTLLANLDEEGKLEWTRAFLDGSFVPAKRGGEEIGLTKVGKGTKQMVATDGEGTPLGFLLAKAFHAEVKLAPRTLDRVRVPRWQGRPRKRPERLVADRAYDSDLFRKWLRSKGVRPCIPTRKNHKDKKRCKTWEQEYKERWRVERTFAWLENYRRLLVRDE